MNPDALDWRKSSRSAPKGDCVQVARQDLGHFLIGDTKNPGVHIRVTSNKFFMLLAVVKAGRLDLA
ncbi:DUF397 domain-containing protein [Amycolatopsis sp. WAC 04197]|uniref:DUF397 domain-containing protein n=1 Tax=Amycolatopsis sp. WAC 04197 TaxID=2203199 RepID=UPI000F78D522|nr:DUF397 domain-containing protein [Amycolatopsis sp. WAC 04197]RSN40048.1 DUF397 domain-containing protein [Amycolatopsis sp. WAC 04197]